MGLRNVDLITEGGAHPENIFQQQTLVIGALRVKRRKGVVGSAKQGG